MCPAAAQAISLFGTDFSLMEKMFPGRHRKALKLKLRREYKDHTERVDAALSGEGSGAKSYQEVVNALHKVRVALLERVPPLQPEGCRCCPAFSGFQRQQWLISNILA
jgi:hypothetical protein